MLPKKRINIGCVVGAGGINGCKLAMGARARDPQHGTQPAGVLINCPIGEP